MSETPHETKKIVGGKANWLGDELQQSSDWIHIFDAKEIDEIEEAVTRATSLGCSLETLTKEEFPLPTLTVVLADVRHELEDGRGLKLLRGFPTSRFSRDTLRLIYWGIGLHIGTSVSQSKRNDYLGDVGDLGTGLDGPKFRGYTSSGELTYHSDAADVTGLFCLHPARKGGLSRIVSAVAIHNEILRTHPDSLDVLYQPYYWSMQGNELPGVPAYYTQPIFAVHEGYFASRYTRTHIRSAEMMPDLPGLTPEQSEALNLIDEISARPEFHLTMMFKPGDIQRY